MAFPSSIPSYIGFTSTHTLAVDQHGSQHNQEQADIVALATKMGTGASTSTNNTVLRGNGTGTTTFDQIHLATDVSGVLSINNGGTNTTTSTGTGSVVLNTSPTTTNEVLAGQPTISDFTNALHGHTNASSGGKLNGNTALQSASVGPNILATGAAVAVVATSETTTSITYADLATTTDSVTVTIGSNGLALVSLLANMVNGTTNAFAWTSFVVSGANTIAAADINAIMAQNNGGGVAWQLGNSILLTALSPGSTTFKMKYRVQTGGGGSGTGTFLNRQIAVVPL